MSSSVLPEVVWRAFKSEDSTQFVFEVEAALLALIHKCKSVAPRDLGSADKELTFPAGDSFQRQLVHRIGERFGLGTESKGEGFERRVVVTPDSTLRERYDAAQAPPASAAPAATRHAPAKQIIGATSTSFRVGHSALDPEPDDVMAHVSAALAGMAVSSATLSSTRVDRPTYDHVVELRFVSPSMTNDRVSELLCAATGLKLLAMLRFDDTVRVAVFSSAEQAQKALAVFQHATIRVTPLSPVAMRVLADEIPPPPRPVTTKAVASRLITSALGGRSGIRQAQEEMSAIQAAQAKPAPAPAPSSGAWVPPSRANRGVDGDWRSSKASSAGAAPSGGAGGGAAVGSGPTPVSLTLAPAPAPAPVPAPAPAPPPAPAVKGRGAVMFGSGRFSRSGGTHRL